MSIGETVGVIGGLLTITGVVFGILFRAWQVISSYDKLKKSITDGEKSLEAEIKDEAEARRREDQLLWDGIRDANRRIDGLFVGRRNGNGD